jgi:hypothetical protein
VGVEAERSCAQSDPERTLGRWSAGLAAPCGEGQQAREERPTGRPASGEHGAMIAAVRPLR